MHITEIKIKMVIPQADKLLAFATITFEDAFVIRDIKVIQGNCGLFVAMPSRKITGRCHHCAAKNHMLANFCNQCGKRLPERRSQTDARGRAKLHADIAHPINSRSRNELQMAVVNAFKKELERSKQPGYVPPSFDDLDAGPEDLDYIQEPTDSDAKRPAVPVEEVAVEGAGPDSPPPAKPGESKQDRGGFGVFGAP